MEALWAVLVSVGLVVGGLLLLAVLVWLTGLGGARGRGPGGDAGPVAVDGACEPGRGSGRGADLGGGGEGRPGRRSALL
jgi:hypothetical protein